MESTAPASRLSVSVSVSVFRRSLLVPTPNVSVGKTGQVNTAFPCSPTSNDAARDTETGSRWLAQDMQGLLSLIRSSFRLFPNAIPQ